MLLASDNPAVEDWRQAVPAIGKLFLVGDSKQSIYRFRRADVFMGGELRPPEYERLETTAGAVGAVMQAARRGAR